MNEFDLIATYFRPLTQGFDGSLQLRDDAALLTVPSGYQLAVTVDALSAGVHFLGTEDPALIARKALRTNLSDLAAMGATPHCYFLTLMLPALYETQWVQRFAEGLAEDQQCFSIALAGGDTIGTQGPLSISITAHGLVPQGQALTRSGPKPGDKIYVSGTLGDSALGLDMLQGRITSQDDYLIGRYFLPEPRLTLGESLRGITSSCMDISDGLMQDLGHICTVSKVGASVTLEQLPLSDAAYALVTQDATLWPRIFNGGDDYELLFTVPPEKEAMLLALALPVTPIGGIVAGELPALYDKQGHLLPSGQGFSHGRTHGFDAAEKKLGEKGGEA